MSNQEYKVKDSFFHFCHSQMNLIRRCVIHWICRRVCQSEAESICVAKNVKQEETKILAGGGTNRKKWMP